MLPGLVISLLMNILIFQMYITNHLTLWGWGTHISVSKLTIISLDNGLSLGQRQAIIWTNAGILLFGPLGTTFSQILIKIQTFSLTKICLKMLSAKCCPFRLSLNVITHQGQVTHRCVSKVGQYWLRWWLVACRCQAIVSAYAGLLLLEFFVKFEQKYNSFHSTKWFSKCLWNGCHFVSAPMCYVIYLLDRYGCRIAVLKYECDI